jgi:hypothetical protein
LKDSKDKTIFVKTQNTHTHTETQSQTQRKRERERERESEGEVGVNTVGFYIHHHLLLESTHRQKSSSKNVP